MPPTSPQQHRHGRHSKKWEKVKRQTGKQIDKREREKERKRKGKKARNRHGGYIVAFNFTTTTASMRGMPWSPPKEKRKKRERESAREKREREEREREKRERKEGQQMICETN